MPLNNTQVTDVNHLQSIKDEAGGACGIDDIGCLKLDLIDPVEDWWKPQNHTPTVVTPSRI